MRIYDPFNRDYMLSAPPKIKGACFGVDFFTSEKSKDILIQIYVEDDGNWFPMGTPFSSYWLGEILRLLKQAENYLTKHHTKTKWGFRLKGKTE